MVLGDRSRQQPPLGTSQLEKVGHFPMADVIVDEAIAA
jgi:hypothetical protein